MNKEIEKKYQLQALPDGLVNGNKIRQGYLDKEEYEVIMLIREKFGQEIDLETIKEVRIRQKGEEKAAKYYFTLKSDGTLERDEYEVAIKAEEFIDLWPLATEGTIEKIRYEVALDHELTGEIDRYDGNLEGLYTMEIEYDPESADAIALEEAVRSITDQATDVTELKTFKNKVLAKIRSLEELALKIKKEQNEKMMRDLNANPNQFNLA